MSTESIIQSHTPSLLLAVAVQAARRAATHALQQRERRQEANLIARHDVKLELDLECQQIATDSILACFPGDAILGEEDIPGSDNQAAASAPDAARQWIVDPIDGTVNFFHGNSYWCCSIAVRQDGQTLAGCVYAPELDLLFEAAADQPALCNGEPIRCSDTATLDVANIHTGADKSADPGSQPFRFFNRIASLAQRARIFGAAALDICQVAAGTADAYFEPGIYLWDIAAADLILQQAGGRGEVLRHFGGHRLAYLGSNGQLHAPLVEVLEPLFQN